MHFLPCRPSFEMIEEEEEDVGRKVGFKEDDAQMQCDAIIRCERFNRWIDCVEGGGRGGMN